jgi:hypothetical protein
MAAACPPRPAATATANISTTTQAGINSEGEGRRSNIYSLLN